jgi:hypothetical protein
LTQRVKRLTLRTIRIVEALGSGISGVRSIAIGGGGRLVLANSNTE